MELGKSQIPNSMSQMISSTGIFFGAKAKFKPLPKTLKTEGGKEKLEKLITILLEHEELLFLLFSMLKKLVLNPESTNKLLLIVLMNLLS